MIKKKLKLLKIYNVNYKILIYIKYIINKTKI